MRGKSVPLFAETNKIHVTPSLSILQISDLHRERSSPIRNDALISSLQNDRNRYNIDIRVPDIIVVSGDIIRGVPPGTADYEEQLNGQYEEALLFLEIITQQLLDGDRERLVLVPGNHDVSACHFMQSVERLELDAGNKRELLKRMLHPGSRLRWSWRDLSFYEIVDAERYAQRLAPFATFYEKFYQRKRTFDLDPANQFTIFDYPDFDLTIVGFSSCYDNDSFNKQGAIHPGCIASASLALRNSSYNGRLRVAVWHHNTEGSPMQTDYMDAGILQNLLDSGFSIGLHGHQHRAQYFDTCFNYGGDAHISVISAGTLCGNALPHFRRAYNIIEFDLEQCKGRLHVREMQNANAELPIWASRSLPPDANEFLIFTFDPPPPPSPTIAPSPEMTELLKAQRLFEATEYATAAELLLPHAASDNLARRLLLDCFGELNETAQIAAYFDPPRSKGEAIYLMEALWQEQHFQRLRALLDEPIVAESNDPAVVETRRKYKARIHFK